MTNNEYNGIVLIDKDAGATSFSVDSRIKRLFGTRKVGHSGTLDPFATGLLPIFVGAGLRFVRYTDNYDKSYRATAILGASTDTMDRDGKVVFGGILAEDKCRELLADDAALIRKAFAEIKNTELQLPPKYSAKKINGRKAYDLARAGVEFELKANKIKIYEININSINECQAHVGEVTFDSLAIDFTVSCSKGTYIRTICEDLGRILGVGAYCDVLRRLTCGPFKVADAITIDRLEELLNDGNAVINSDTSYMLPGDTALEFMPELKLNEVQLSMVCCGKKLKAAPFMSIVSQYPAEQRFRATFDGRVAAVLYYAEEPSTDTDAALTMLKVMRIERMLWK